MFRVPVSRLPGFHHLVGFASLHPPCWLKRCGLLTSRPLLLPVLVPGLTSTYTLVDFASCPDWLCYSPFPQVTARPTITNSTMPGAAMIANRRPRLSSSGQSEYHHFKFLMFKFFMLPPLSYSATAYSKEMFLYPLESIIDSLQVLSTLVVFAIVRSPLVSFGSILPEVDLSFSGGRPVSVPGWRPIREGMGTVSPVRQTFYTARRLPVLT